MKVLIVEEKPDLGGLWVNHLDADRRWTQPSSTSDDGATAAMQPVPRPT